MSKITFSLALMFMMAGTTFAQKPNVIILFSDQHNKKVMGFEGHPDVITPNLDQLDEAGLEEETIVIYTSDHGDFVGNHGMVEKAAAGQNVYEDILNIPLIFKYPGKAKKGERTAELVTLADILPTLIDMLELNTPAFKYPIQGESMADVILKNASMNREYVISESWSQATVITKNQKLGMMIDPTVVHENWDYRDFGDMFFDMEKDPLETDNRISDKKYQEDINKLKGYYYEFVKNTPATGKDEMVNQKMILKETK